MNVVDVGNEKEALRLAIASLPNKGGLPQPSPALETAIQALEAVNPTAAPTQAPALLSGLWRTVYTTSRELVTVGRAIPGFHSGGIYQYVDASTGLLCNVAEVDGPGYLGGIVAVRAKLNITSETRANVDFTLSLIGSQTVMNYDRDRFLHLLLHYPERLPGLKIKFSDKRPQKGWLEITYLDQDLRIGRGNQGSIFVLERVPHTAGV